jgi:O-methyltransferase
MRMKRYINNFLKTFLSVKLVKTGKNIPRAYQINDFTTKKLIYLNELLVKSEQIDGDVVECGVGWGFSLYCISNSLQMLGSNKKVWGFDSFEGLPSPTNHDEPFRDNVKIIQGDLNFSEEFVKKRLTLSGLSPKYIESNIKFVKGYFEQSFLKEVPTKISFLNIDVDLYDSYLLVLNQFYSSVQKGGIIAFDEYNDGKWVGATKAIDLFFKDKPEKLRKANCIDRYYIIKE